MGNNDSKTEIKAQDSREGSSVDPVPQTKTLSGGDVSRDVMPEDECVLENELPATTLSSGPLIPGKDVVDNDAKEEVIQDHTSESKTDDIDGQNSNHDEVPSSVSAPSQVLDVVKDDKTTKVLTDKEDDVVGETKGLPKNDTSNNQTTSEDLDQNSDSKSGESYNSEEVCPIIDDLEFISEDSDTLGSDDNEVSEKEASVISNDNDESQKEAGILSGNNVVSKIEGGTCSAKHELLNTKASDNSEELNRETKEEIQKQVERCLRSMEQLERDHRDILNLVNKRSESQRELNKDGMSIIGELESIVENFTQRRKEKDEAIRHLKTILSKLTENLSVIEKEIHDLQSNRTSMGFHGEEKNMEKSEERKETKHPVMSQTVKANDVEQDSAESEKQDWRKTIETRHHENNEGSQQSSMGQWSSDENKKVNSNSVSNSHGIPLPKPQSSSSQESDKHVKINCQGISENKPSENVFQSRPAKQVDKSVSEEEREVTRGNKINPNVVQSHSGQSNGSKAGRQQVTNVNPNKLQSDSEQSSESVARQQEETNIVNSKSNSGQSSESVARRQEEITNQSNIPDRDTKKNFSISASKQREILNPGYWVDKANEILRRNALEGPADNACGPNTVLCLDTSDSMWGNAFRTMIDLALRFLSGVENNPTISEKVGLVCFGAETKVISRCCLDYPRLKQEINRLSPGGPSPLTAGLMLSLPLTRGVTIPHMDGMGFFPRIIVITDGVATPELVTANDDFVPDMSELMMINNDIMSMARHFKEGCNRVYCVPVGQANDAIISPLVEATSGKIVQPANFDKLIHQFHTEFIAAALRNNFPDYRKADPYMVRTAAEASVVSHRDLNMDDLVEYVRNPPPQRGQNDDDDDDDALPSEGSSNMPPIGTRVRRGPDWSSEFIGQDGDGPGTIVDHGRGGFIRVMWDNGHLNIYPYGASGRFAVIVVDEPRILQQDQFIEVGCLVRRGDNWRDDDEDGGRGNIGVVFRVHTDGTVGVRWPNGRKRRYKYGRQGFFEVEICDPFDEEVRFRMLSMNFQWQENNEEKRTKSKSQVTTEDQPRIEDIVNSDDRNKNNNKTLEEMNRRNALRSKRIEDQLETDSEPLSVEESSKSTSGGTSRETDTVNIQEQCENLNGASAIQTMSLSSEKSQDLKTNSGVLIQPMPESNPGKDQEKSADDIREPESDQSQLDAVKCDSPSTKPVIIRSSLLEVDGEIQPMPESNPGQEQEKSADDIREPESDQSQLDALKCDSPSTKPVIISSSSLEVDGEINQDYADKTEENQKKDTTEPADEEPVEEQSDRLNVSCSSSSDISSNSDTTFGSDVSTVVQEISQTSSPSSSIDEITISAQTSHHSSSDADQLPKAPDVSVAWQVHDRYEGWKDFPEEISSRLEKVYQRNPQGTCSYIKNNKRFQVQLSKMIHIHPVTKEISNVKRNVTNV